MEVGWWSVWQATLCFYSWMKAKDCSPAFKKQDTAGDRTLSWQCQECHHRGLLLFVVAVRAKAKPGGTKYLFLQEKKTHPRLAVIISPLQRGFLLLVTKLKLENRKLVSPIPSMAHNSVLIKFQMFQICATANTSILGDAQSLLSIPIWQEG